MQEDAKFLVDNFVEMMNEHGILIYHENIYYFNDRILVKCDYVDLAAFMKQIFSERVRLVLDIYRECTKDGFAPSVKLIIVGNEQSVNWIELVDYVSLNDKSKTIWDIQTRSLAEDILDFVEEECENLFNAMQ